MTAPLLTKAEVLELAREMRAHGVRRWKVGEVEVEYGPPTPPTSDEVLQWQAQMTEKQKKLRRAAEKEKNDPARKKPW